MFYIELIAAILIVSAFIHYFLTKRHDNYKLSLITSQIDASEEIKKTLAMGVYLRFKKEEEQAKKFSINYIKESPIEFELFAASILEKTKGGSTWVSPASGDFGVDFEHTVNGELFLGQVKCCQGDLSFEPIALIHSNIIKRNAKGGYVITTGSFTSSAKEYAKELNIELIDGVRLVELWITSLSNAEQEIKKMTPEYT
ncbi:restriction endonuclease [Niallia sp. 01092]|uniref:restriction endonuclease n=1 Tax=unclassified Niallia TaxID=2837522 RepID=UPI003FD176F3